MGIDEFQRLVRQLGEELYRDMPWRQDTRPYYVLVSELMLQQTQVDRVIPKFEAFIKKFPSERDLADAPLAEVLKAWQGLGYNRRAKFLHEAAKNVAKLGEFPNDEPSLVALPGVGKNTAGAILAYAYNKPAIFIETNVRAVYIYHFFANQDDVDDKDIRKMLEQTIDREHPREFYWGLMDYGSYLKKQGVRPSQSRHYVKQPPLSGSIREVRGQILKILSEGDTTMQFLEAGYAGDERLDPALSGLEADGLIMIDDNDVYLTK
jgi:A/G-specific adenine glycosylase